ncbi:MAG: lipid II flippase MurJ [Microbacterium sp.]
MSSHARASAIIGAGTLVSRLTGLVRSIMLISVVGLTTSNAADAFTTANMLPTNIYELLAAGVITGIIVPQIVRAAQHHDGGSAYISKLLTLGTVLLVVATIVVLAMAPVLIWIYAPGYGPDQRALTLALAYWCLPQLLFYGLYALIGEVLNARRVFGPYSWAPTVNNLVSIAGFGVFLLVFGGPFTDVLQWDASMIALLGGTATLGIGLQAGVLAFFWRRTRLTIHADFHWRNMGLRHLGMLAFWTFVTVVVGQVAGAVQQAVISTATDISGPAVFLTAWLIFMLPHSVVAMSISTTYFTQLAEQVSQDRTDLVQGNLDESIRALSVFAFGFMAALAAASVPVAVFFTGERTGAPLLALNVCAFLIALVPFGVMVIVRRAFFAFNDTRTPFRFALAQAIVTAAGAVLAFVVVHSGLLPLAFLSATVAFTQSLAMFVQLPIALRLLRRHTGDISFSATWRALGRFAVASVPAFIVGLGIFLLTGAASGWTVHNRLTGFLGTALVGGASIAVYIGMLALLRAPELAVGLRALRRFPKR